MPAGFAPAVARAVGADRPELHVRTEHGALQADVGDGLTARFDMHGVTVSGETGSVRMALVAVGRDGAPTQSLPGVRPQARVNEVRFTRAGLQEWFLNGPFGLEQGFSLDRRPVGGAPELRLGLALSGPLARLARTDGSGVRFGSISYGGLWAFDARGRRLPARMELGDGRLDLVVRDRGARYPLTVDPTFNEVRLDPSSPVASANFGFAVAVDGGTAVVAAPGTGGSGTLYVFERPGGGWASATETARLSHAGFPSATTGYSSVAISGDTIVAGASSAEAEGHFNQGLAAVWVRGGPSWTTTTSPTAVLTESTGAANDAFGHSVAIDGSTVVIGVPSGSGGGRAAVYTKPGGGWATTGTPTATLTDDDNGPSDDFGYGVAIAGDSIAVGVPSRSSLDGTVAVYVRPGATWATTNLPTALLANGIGGAERVGYSVAMTSSTIVAGALDAALSDGGAAYVYSKPGGGWATTTTPTAQLTATSGVNGDYVGEHVAVSGTRVAVGARYHASGKGIVYVYDRPGSGWATTSTPTAELEATGGAASDGFGYGVATNGTDVISGATGVAAPGPLSSAGAAYVYVGAVPCSAGTYSDGSSCVPAPAGSYVAASGATSATPCAAGTFQPSTGATSCITAMPGSYVPGTGASKALACPAGDAPGLETPAAGPGSYQDGYGQAQCTLAPPGTYVAAAGARAATPCEPGTWSPVAGKGACLPAFPGMYADAAGLSLPRECPPGTYQEAFAQTSCTPVPRGAFSLGSRFLGTGGLFPGFISTDQIRFAMTPTPCPQGTISSATGAAACTPCPANRVSAPPVDTLSGLGGTVCIVEPAVRSVGPERVTVETPFTVTLTGAGFTRGATVTGGVRFSTRFDRGVRTVGECTVREVTSSTLSCRLVAPDEVVRVVFRVTVEGVDSDWSSEYVQVVPRRPVITRISPDIVAERRAASFTIDATNMPDDPVVKYGPAGQPATRSCTIQPQRRPSPGRLICKTGDELKGGETLAFVVGDRLVTSPAGKDTVTVLGTPEIVDVEPGLLWLADTTKVRVTLSGADFPEGKAVDVRFGPAGKPLNGECDVVSVSPASRPGGRDSLVCTAEIDDIGRYSFAVSDRLRASLPSKAVLEARPRFFFVDEVAPRKAFSGTRTTITLTGSDFPTTPTLKVAFGPVGKAAKESCAILKGSAQRITCTAVFDANGTYAFVVSDRLRESVPTQTGVSVTTKELAVQSVAPGRVVIGPDEVAVTLTGREFPEEGAAVRYGKVGGPLDATCEVREATSGRITCSAAFPDEGRYSFAVVDGARVGARSGDAVLAAPKSSIDRVTPGTIKGNTLAEILIEGTALPDSPVVTIGDDAGGVPRECTVKPKLWYLPKEPIREMTIACTLTSGLRWGLKYRVYVSGGHLTAPLESPKPIEVQRPDPALRVFAAPGRVERRSGIGSKVAVEAGLDQAGLYPWSMDWGAQGYGAGGGGGRFSGGPELTLTGILVGQDDPEAFVKSLRIFTSPNVDGVAPPWAGGPRVEGRLVAYRIYQETDLDGEPLGNDVRVFLQFSIVAYIDDGSYKGRSSRGAYLWVTAADGATTVAASDPGNTGAFPYSSDAAPARFRPPQAYRVAGLDGGCATGSFPGPCRRPTG